MTSTGHANSCVCDLCVEMTERRARLVDTSDRDAAITERIRRILESSQ